MAKTCCPLYTIKCNATDFQLSKSQKKVLKKFRNFLLHDKRPPGSEKGSDESGKGEEDEGMDGEVNDELEEKSKKMETALGLTDLPPSEELKISSTTNCLPPSPTKAGAPPSPMVVAKEPSRRNPPAPGSGADPTKPQLGKAKAQRRARKLAKQAAAGRIDEVAAGGGSGKEEGGRSVDDWLGLKWGEVDGETPAHVFTTRLVPAQDDNDMFRETFQDSLKIYQNYQQVGQQ